MNVNKYPGTTTDTEILYFQQKQNHNLVEGEGQLMDVNILADCEDSLRFDRIKKVSMNITTVEEQDHNVVTSTSGDYLDHNIPQNSGKVQPAIDSGDNVSVVATPINEEAKLNNSDTEAIASIELERNSVLSNASNAHHLSLPLRATTVSTNEANSKEIVESIIQKSEQLQLQMNEKNLEEQNYLMNLDIECLPANIQTGNLIKNAVEQIDHVTDIAEIDTITTLTTATTIVDSKSSNSTEVINNLPAISSASTSNLNQNHKIILKLSKSATGSTLSSDLVSSKFSSVSTINVKFDGENPQMSSFNGGNDGESDDGDNEKNPALIECKKVEPLKINLHTAAVINSKKQSSLLHEIVDTMVSSEECSSSAEDEVMTNKPPNATIISCSSPHIVPKLTIRAAGSETLGTVMNTIVPKLTIKMSDGTPPPTLKSINNSEDDSRGDSNASGDGSVLGIIDITSDRLKDIDLTNIATPPLPKLTIKTGIDGHSESIITNVSPASSVASGLSLCNSSSSTSSSCSSNSSNSSSSSSSSSSSMSSSSSSSLANFSVAKVIPSNLLTFNSFNTAAINDNSTTLIKPSIITTRNTEEIIVSSTAVTKCTLSDIYTNSTTEAKAVLLPGTAALTTINTQGISVPNMTIKSLHEPSSLVNSKTLSLSTSAVDTMTSFSKEVSVQSIDDAGCSAVAKIPKLTIKTGQEHAVIITQHSDDTSNSVGIPKLTIKTKSKSLDVYENDEDEDGEELEPIVVNNNSSSSNSTGRGNGHSSNIVGEKIPKLTIKTGIGTGRLDSNYCNNEKKISTSTPLSTATIPKLTINVAQLEQQSPMLVMSPATSSTITSGSLALTVPKLTITCQTNATTMMNNEHNSGLTSELTKKEGPLITETGTVPKMTIKTQMRNKRKSKFTATIKKHTSTNYTAFDNQKQEHDLFGGKTNSCLIDNIDNIDNEHNLQYNEHYQNVEGGSKLVAEDITDDYCNQQMPPKLVPKLTIKNLGSPTLKMKVVRGDETDSVSVLNRKLNNIVNNATSSSLSDEIIQSLKHPEITLVNGNFDSVEQETKSCGIKKSQINIHNSNSNNNNNYTEAGDEDEEGEVEEAAEGENNLSRRDSDDMDIDESLQKDHQPQIFNNMIRFNESSDTTIRSAVTTEASTLINGTAEVILNVEKLSPSKELDIDSGNRIIRSAEIIDTVDLTSTSSPDNSVDRVNYAIDQPKVVNNRQVTNAPYNSATTLAASNILLECLQREHNTMSRTGSGMCVDPALLTNQTVGFDQVLASSSSSSSFSSSLSSASSTLSSLLYTGQSKQTAKNTAALSTASLKYPQLAERLLMSNGRKSIAAVSTVANTTNNNHRHQQQMAKVIDSIEILDTPEGSPSQILNDVGGDVEANYGAKTMMGIARKQYISSPPNGLVHSGAIEQGADVHNNVRVPRVPTTVMNSDSSFMANHLTNIKHSDVMGQEFYAGLHNNLNLHAGVESSNNKKRTLEKESLSGLEWNACTSSAASLSSPPKRHCISTIVNNNMYKEVNATTVGEILVPLPSLMTSTPSIANFPKSSASSELKSKSVAHTPQRTRKQRHEHLLEDPVEDEMAKMPLSMRSLLKNECSTGDNLYINETTALGNHFPDITSSGKNVSSPNQQPKRRGRPRKILNSETEENCKDLSKNKGKRTPKGKTPKSLLHSPLLIGAESDNKNSPEKAMENTSLTHTPTIVSANDQATKSRRVQLLKKRLAIDMVDGGDVAIIDETDLPKTAPLLTPNATNNQYENQQAEALESRQSVFGQLQMDQNDLDDSASMFADSGKRKRILRTPLRSVRLKASSNMNSQNQLKNNKMSLPSLMSPSSTGKKRGRKPRGSLINNNLAQCLSASALEASDKIIYNHFDNQNSSNTDLSVNNNSNSMASINKNSCNLMQLNNDNANSLSKTIKDYGVRPDGQSSCTADNSAVSASGGLPWSSLVSSSNIIPNNSSDLGLSSMQLLQGQMSVRKDEVGSINNNSNNPMLPPTTILSSSNPLPDVIFKSNDFSSILVTGGELNQNQSIAGDNSVVRSGEHSEEDGQYINEDKNGLTDASDDSRGAMGSWRGRGAKGRTGSVRSSIGVGRGHQRGGTRTGRGASATAKTIALNRPRCMGALKHTPDPQRLKGLFSPSPQVFEEDTRMSADLNLSHIVTNDLSRQSEAFSNEESQSQTSMVSSASLQLAGDAALSNVNSAMSATGERIEGGATTTATSITANATGLSSAKKPKKKKMEVCISEEADFTVASIAEYDWPPPKGCCPSKNRDTFMIQEQVALYLGIKSFKRKYPELPRRQIDMEERNWLQEKGLVSERMCDLGITAVWASDILDIMYADFYAKYEEYKDYVRQKHLREIETKQKAFGLNVTAAGRNLQARDRSLLSASKWNSYLLRSRKEERLGGCFDMQTFTVNKPLPTASALAITVERPMVEAITMAVKDVQVSPPPLSVKHQERTNQIIHSQATRDSYYALSLVPGQFCKEYYSYRPEELIRFPLNTVLDHTFIRSHENIANKSMETLDTDMTLVPENNTVLADNDSTLKTVRPHCRDQDRCRNRPTKFSMNANSCSDKSDSDSSCSSSNSSRSSSSSSSDGSLSTGSLTSDSSDSTLLSCSSALSSVAKEKCKIRRKKKRRDRNMALNTTAEDHSDEEETAISRCGVCLQEQNRNLRGKPERFLQCYTCRRKVHPSCIEMPHRMMLRARNYNWQCSDCKCCIKCKRKQNNNKMLFCEQCDRGFHIYCLGLKAVPEYRWSCERCSVCLRCGATNPEGIIATIKSLNVTAEANSTSIANNELSRNAVMKTWARSKTEKPAFSSSRWYNDYRIDHLSGLREHCSMLCIPCSQLIKQTEPPDTITPISTAPATVTTKTLNSTVTSADLTKSTNNKKISNNNNSNNNNNNNGIISSPFSPITNSIAVCTSSSSNAPCSKSHTISTSATTVAAHTHSTEIAPTTQSISTTLATTTNVAVNSSLSATEGSPPVVA